MADTENMYDIQIEKNSKILVNVDEALPDILVVTYEYGSKIFQGVLLDSTKRNLPYGVTALNPAFSNNDKTDGDDRLFSVNQRFTYQDGVSSVTKEFTQKRSVKLPARYKNAKMTVRLRPRQVLCSKCRGICNENSENVDAARKRKIEDESSANRQQQQKRLPTAPVTRNSRPLSSDSQSNEQQRMCLRLAPTVLHEDKQSTSPESSTVDNNFDDTVQIKSEFKDFKEPSPRKEGKNKRMVLRKKKSVGSMEDLWDESVFEENAAAAAAAAAAGQAGIGTAGDLSHSTKTIKISFGREGEGTVLKIPAKIEDLDAPGTEDATEKIRIKDASAKAARRALKKAKKEARRKILLGSGGSPCYALGSGSPRYTLAGSSPRYTLASTASSPRHPHSIGGHSPRYAVTATTPNYDNFVPRRHKHKVKHKKKHREDRRTQRDPLQINPAATETPVVDESYTAMKESCLKQKLSINLKRLNASAYTRCDDEDPSSTPLQRTAAADDLGSGGSECSDVPDFPAPLHPLTGNFTAQTVASGLGADGRRLFVGDVVWGKIHGFPWWPGKVLSFTELGGSGGAPQAHVSWYGSSTSSLMPCDQLMAFLENFKIRYNKKKRGPYKEAIKQATCEARIESSPSPAEALPTPTSDLFTTPTPAATPMQSADVIPSQPPLQPTPLVQPALASPREIDVVS